MTDEVREVLVNLVEAKRVAEANGKYLLTPAARMALDSDYSRLYADVRVQSGFQGRLRRLRTAERRAQGTDHRLADLAGRRRAVAERSQQQGLRRQESSIGLASLHERAETRSDRLAGVVPRIQIYDEKLRAALGKGPRTAPFEWVSDAKIESYHTLWFELHEDLLRLMWRERDE